MNIKINLDGKYVRTAKVKKPKLNWTQVLLNKLNKEANILRNKRLLSLQKCKQQYSR